MTNTRPTQPCAAFPEPARRNLQAILAEAGPDAPQVVDVEMTLHMLGKLGETLELPAVVVLATLRNQVIGAIAEGPLGPLHAADRIERAVNEAPLSELRDLSPGFREAVTELLRRVRSVPMNPAA